MDSRLINDQAIHDRIYEILSQKAALGLGDSFGHDFGYGEGEGEYGAGGPPLTYAKYKKYYARHRLGPITEKAMKKAFNDRLLGKWVAQSRGTAKGRSHKIVRKVGKRKVGGPKAKAKRKVGRPKAKALTKKGVSNRMRLKQMKVAELKALLKAAGDRGYSKLKKASLVNRAVKLGL